MAIDQDVIDMFQPLIDDLKARVSAIESSGGGGSVDLTEILSRLDAIESTINVPVNPDTVVQTYEDGTSVTYNRVKEVNG